jgi:hypothetical protein
MPTITTAMRVGHIIQEQKRIYQCAREFLLTVEVLLSTNRLTYTYHVPLALPSLHMSWMEYHVIHKCQLILQVLNYSLRIEKIKLYAYIKKL